MLIRPHGFRFQRREVSFELLYARLLPQHIALVTVQARTRLKISLKLADARLFSGNRRLVPGKGQAAGLVPR